VRIPALPCLARSQAKAGKGIKNADYARTTVYCGWSGMTNVGSRIRSELGMLSKNTRGEIGLEISWCYPRLMERTRE